MGRLSYQKNAEQLQSVIDNRKHRENAADSLAEQKSAYAALANERLANIARGESSPWLAIQMGAKEMLRLNPLALQAGVPQQTEVQRRESTWDRMKRQAEAAAQSGQPFNPNFSY